MEEYWDLYDKYRIKTGLRYLRASDNEFPEEMFHLIVEVWVVTPEGKVLLTKRHPQKPCGLMWECPGGCVISGESSIEGALRELAEEVGIKLKIKDLHYLGETVMTNYFVDSYLYKGDVVLTQLSLQEEEVVDAALVSFEGVKKMHQRGQIIPATWERYKRFIQEELEK